MSTKEYYSLLLACLDSNMDYYEKNPPYKVNKYNSEDYADGLNEGYIAGMRRVKKLIEDSEFLVNR